VAFIHVRYINGKLYCHGRGYQLRSKTCVAQKARTINKDKQPLTLAWRYLRALFLRLTGEWRTMVEPRVSAEEVDTAMKAASIPSISFFFLLVLSSAIATFGLLANSAPAIIGAMIIAPLMTPIMGLSYGVIQLSWSQIARSFITVVLGVLVVVVISYLCSRFIDIRVTGTEMLSRAFPTLLDLGVAMAAGAAGAYVLSRESIRNSIAGVAIAVALVPPLAVVGIGLELGRRATADIGLSFREVGLFAGGSDIAVGAFVLFLTSLVAIIMVAGIVMSFLGYGRWKRGIPGLMAVAVASILLMQPLSQETHKLRIKSKTLRLFKTLPVSQPDIFDAWARLDTLRIRYQDDLLHIHVEGMASRDRVQGAQERLDQLRLLMEEKIGEPLVVKFEIIPVDILSFQSPPEVETTVGTSLPENIIE
jgi:uncharacterized hydrophobic protein (TIGR00271 family)